MQPLLYTSVSCTLSTITQTTLFACLRTLYSSFTQVAYSYLDTMCFVLFSCTCSLKTCIYVSLSPSPFLTLMSVPSMTLTSNTSPTTYVPVRVRNNQALTKCINSIKEACNELVREIVGVESLKMALDAAQVRLLGKMMQDPTTLRELWSRPGKPIYPAEIEESTNWERGRSWKDCRVQ